MKTKIQIVKKLNNSNDDETQKLKWWQNSKNQIVTKLKKLNCDETLKKNQVMINLKLWQNLNCDKTQTVTKHKMWQNSNCDQALRLKLLQTQKIK